MLKQIAFQRGRQTVSFQEMAKTILPAANIMERSNLLVTAAHCVQNKDTGMIYDNFLFERCYDDGKSSEKLTFKTVCLKEYWHSEKPMEVGLCYGGS